MLNVKKTLNKLLKQVNGLETVIKEYKANITVPSTTFTQLVKVTLPAGGKYILLGYGACGAVTNGSNIAISLNRLSGTANVNYMGTSTGATVGGGAKCVVGYIEPETECVVELREYLYGSGSTTNAVGWIVAVPLRMGGVARRLLNALQSLTLRKAVIVC